MWSKGTRVAREMKENKGAQLITRGPKWCEGLFQICLEFTSSMLNQCLRYASGKI